jgi:hypothetical protein
LKEEHKLQMPEHKMLRKIYGPEKDEENREYGENITTKTFVF